jgi:cytidylate kinase
MTVAPVILVTISRQFGSGGAYIGQNVARRLGFEYIDREILRLAARYLGRDEEALSGREERVGGFWENFFNAFASGVPEAGYVPPPIRPVYDRDLFDAEAAIMNEMAERRDSVIVGRGGFHALRGRPGLANVFIHAPKDFRIARAMDVYNIRTTEEAASLVDEMDHERGRFIREMTGADWTDARNYHLSIDTGRVDFASAEEMTSGLVKSVRSRLGL